jgi:hypothetical protein
MTALTGDPTLADQMIYWQSVYETRQARYNELRSKLSNNTPLTSSEIREWNTLNSPGSRPEDANTYYQEYRTQYLATVPPEDEPLPVYSTPVETDTPEAYAVLSVQNRFTLKQEIVILTTEKQNNQIQIDILQSKETLTPEETTELNLLIADNETLTTNILSKRSEYQLETIKLNSYNTTLRSQSKTPLIDDGTLVLESGLVKTPDEWPDNIQGSYRQDNITQNESAIALLTLEERKNQRQQTYNIIDSEILEYQNTNKTLQNDIERENAEAYQDSTPQSISLRQQRIAELQNQLNTNQKEIDDRNIRKQTLQELDRQELEQINVARATKTRSELNTAKSQRSTAITQYQTYNNLITQEQNRPTPDPAKIYEYTQARNSAYQSYSQADTVVKTKERQWIEEQKSINTKQDVIQTDSSTTIINETNPSPSNSHIDYGVVDENEYNQWKSGAKDDPGQLFDTYTGTWVDSDALDQEGLRNQRYSYVRPVYDLSTEQADYQQQIAGIDSEYQQKQTDAGIAYQSARAAKEYEIYAYNTERQNEIDSIQANIDALNAANAKIDEDETKTPLEKYRAKKQNQEDIQLLESAKKEQEELLKDSNEELSQIDSEYQRTLSTLEAQKQAEINTATTNFQIEARPVSEPVTFEEAQVSLQQQYVSQEKEDLARDRLNWARDNAISRCAASGGDKDCSVPANWDSADQEAVNVANTEWKSARDELQQSNQRIYEMANDSPNGEEMLRAAGMTDEELDAAKAITLQGAGPSPSQGGNAAVSSVDANVGRRTTGFEGLNNHAPFYFQLPSLKAISDFHIRNGYSPYGPRSSDSIARDAVHFNLFELNPPATKAVQSQDGTLVTNVVQDQGTNLLGTFTVYPNNSDWLNLAHNHSWGSDNLSKIANMADSVLGVVDTVQALTSLFNNVGDSFTAGSEQSFAQGINRRIDTIDTYQSTDKLEITIPFVLFTKSGFLEDIYRPLMLLTAMTYPKRLLGGNIATDIKNSIGQLEKITKSLPEGVFRSNALNLLDKAKENFPDAKINEIENKAGRLGGYGPLRYFVTKRPEYMSMRHASGIIYFPMCFIKNIKYEFKGPWYNYDGKPFNNFSTSGQLEKVVGSSISRGLQTWGAALDDIKKIFSLPTESSNSSNGYSANPKLDAAVNDPSLKQIAAYPSIAECSITVRNALPFFRDDWMQMFNGATNPQDLINVSVKQTGQGRLITPNGSILRTPVGLNAGDITSISQSTSYTNPNVKASTAAEATESSVNPPLFAKDNVTGRYDPVTGKRL